ncbi:MAG: polysaccharide deacetylase family protein [bacterium]|nr:polysaccharide deacetylase family protein [bacterium]
MKKKRKYKDFRLLPASLISGALIGLAVIILSVTVHSIYFSPSSTSISKAEIIPQLLKPKPQKILTPTPKVSSSIYVPQTMGNQLKVPILMYHYISNNPNPEDRQRDSLATPPDKFEEQLQYLSQNGYVTITLDTLYAALKKQVTLPSKPIILTFDDGYIDFFINAYPILQKYHFQATVFIPTGLMDQGYYLHWDQIKQMQESGLIHFAAHSVHHYQLTALSRQEALYEMTESKKILQEKLGVPINFMAYPYGSVNQEVINLAGEAGYLGSAGTWRGNIQSEGIIYNMPRLRINGLIDMKTFTELL